MQVKKSVYQVPIIIVLLLGGCTNQGIVCNKPYLQVGNECCVDLNDNRICDRDEKATTTSTTTSSSIASTTNIDSTTSTVPIELIIRYTAQEMIVSPNEVQSIFGEDWDETDTQGGSGSIRVLSSVYSTFSGKYIEIIPNQNLNFRPILRMGVAVYVNSSSARDDYLYNKRSYVSETPKPFNVGDYGILGDERCLFTRDNVVVAVDLNSEFSGRDLGESKRYHPPSYDLEVIRLCRLQDEKLKKFYKIESQDREDSGFEESSTQFDNEIESQDGEDSGFEESSTQPDNTPNNIIVELIELKLNKTIVNPNERVAIIASVRNDDSNKVPVYFKGEVTLNNQIIATIDGSMEAPVGQSEDIVNFFRPEKPGRYIINGTIQSPGGTSQEDSVVLNVGVEQILGKAEHCWGSCTSGCDPLKGIIQCDASVAIDNIDEVSEIDGKGSTISFAAPSQILVISFKDWKYQSKIRVVGQGYTYNNGELCLIIRADEDIDGVYEREVTNKCWNGSDQYPIDLVVDVKTVHPLLFYPPKGDINIDYIGPA